MSHRDTMRALAQARPHHLDPATPGDPTAITSYPRETAMTPATRRPVGRLVLATALPAAALAVAAAVLIGGTSGPAQPRTAQPTGAQPPASASAAPAELPAEAGAILLVAAARTDAVPAAAGRYWVTRVEHGDRRRIQEERWLAAVDGLPSSSFMREDGPWRARPMQGHRAATNFLLAGQARTLRELAELPTDPAALRRQVLAYDRAVGGTEDGDLVVYYAGIGLVLDLPVSPQVRAAAYRMLAALPGMRSLGPVTDQLGRSGVAVAISRRGDFGTAQQRLIVDRATGLALGVETWTSARLSSYTALIGARWDDGPLPDAAALS
ncbi:hypothetical protein Cs7R123_50960 [Catellatospora sp. TT07R-123]|uniref:CU044_5270 family protein n=1 Tax=Catellatospora sp. TT07R-123 TaxID=2733863 RepID=UPI001B0009ED|nr:CU044_5270 family protein [Catellatospora sp. TT07R-123]GHJ47754.1 hypothetical protein Cs7R123_50960 [Catellatospora sp. TT07R-123]